VAVKIHPTNPNKPIPWLAERCKAVQRTPDRLGRRGSAEHMDWVVRKGWVVQVAHSKELGDFPKAAGFERRRYDGDDGS